MLDVEMFGPSAGAAHLLTTALAVVVAVVAALDTAMAAGAASAVRVLDRSS
jgi:hypothetical protein